jgi:2-polyprenyl-3-methyl-5-hydroxy-6-metoxy-1,4-benzoquinol methylase
VPDVSIKAAEQRWHDQHYKQHAQDEYPPTPEAFLEYFRRIHLTGFCEGGWSYWGDTRCEALQMIGSVRGRRVLDYGCGSGQLGIYLALQGADVSGFDLSPWGVATARRAAEAYAVPAEFRAADAEDLDYPDNSFDLVIGLGVLHHVIKYARAAEQLHRVLRPGAKAYFLETLWDNPAINFARRFTTLEEDAGDARLTARRIVEFGADFRSLTLHPRHLLYMCKRLARLPERDVRRPLRARPMWRALKKLDSFLARTPLRHYCGEVIVVLEK